MPSPTRRPLAPYSIVYPVPTLTLAAFCGLHGLVIEVNERDTGTQTFIKSHVAPGKPCRYWVSLRGFELVDEEGIQVSPHGDGDTVPAAIKDLTKLISGRRARIRGIDLYPDLTIDVPKLKT